MTVLTDSFTDEDLDLVDTRDSEYFVAQAKQDAANDFINSLPPSTFGGAVSAPHGFKSNGEPYKRCHKLCANHPNKQSSTPKVKQARAARGVTDYTESLNGLFQLAALPLTFVAPADAWAVTVHAPSISEAVNDLAQQRPEVAAVLDRVLQVGPYGALIAAVLPLAVQLLANHKLFPAGLLGTNSKEDILAHLEAEAMGVSHREE